MICEYVSGHKAGEITEPGTWAVWTEYDCMLEDDCPVLDDFNVECPIKENHLKSLEDWAIRKLAGERKDRFARVRELRAASEEAS